jgi:hypothetical protein
MLNQLVEMKKIAQPIEKGISSIINQLDNPPRKLSVHIKMDRKSVWKMNLFTKTSFKLYQTTKKFL